MIDRKYLGGHCHKHRLIVTAENRTKQGVRQGGEQDGS